MERAEQTPRPARGWKRRLAAAGAVLVAGAAAFGVQRCVDTARHATRQTLCVHNLKHVHLALKRYAEEHEGRLPGKLSELWPKYLPGPDVLVCPELLASAPHTLPPNPSPDDIERLCSYACVPGHTFKDGPDTVLVYEKRDNHFGKGRSLLYLDGRGAWEPPENWRNGPPNRTLPPGF